MTRRQRVSALLAFVYSVQIMSCGPTSPSRNDSQPPQGRGQSGAPLTTPSDTLLPTEVVNGLAVGRISGSGSVSADGAAHYSIPLWAPAGRAGIQPSLSLQYSSRSGNGLLGVGWALNGLSRISRCKRTHLLEGEAREIRFDQGEGGDRFCLDGQRLVVVGGPNGAASVYGGNETEYRTEGDIYAKVVSYAPDAAGPTYFKVYLKDGRILTLGGEGNSTLEGQRGRVTLQSNGLNPSTYPTDYSQKARYAWSLARLEDRAGNYLKVRYTYEAAPTPYTYEQLPEAIDYTASTSDPAASTTRSVQFFYEARPETSDVYVGGLRLRQSKRLKRLEMWGPQPQTAARLRSYVLTYETSPNQRSRLKTLQECDGSDICKPATTFAWSEAQATFQDINTTIQHTTGHLLVGDINADGRDDIIKGSDSYYLSMGTSLDPTARPLKYPFEANPCPNGRERYLDIDSDGRLDLVITGRTFGSTTTGGYNYKNCIYRPSAAGSTYAFTRVEDANEIWEHEARGLYVLDVNGDGLSEWIKGRSPYSYSSPNVGQLLWYRMNAVGALGAYAQTSYRHQNNIPGYVVDVNGSGKSSLLIRDPSPGFLALGLRDGVVTAERLSLSQGGTRHFFADVNGDGLTDAIMALSTGGQLDVALNTGNGFAAPTAWNVGSEYRTGNSNGGIDDSGVRVIDYNGDGRQDLLLMAGHDTVYQPYPPPQVTVLISTGSSFTATRLSNIYIGDQFPGVNADSSTGRPGEPSDWQWSQTLDANGDGLTDMVQVVSGVIHLYIRQGMPGDLLTRVDDGLGAFERFEYLPSSSAAVYTPGTSCQYPTTCTREGLWLVRLHETDSGVAQPRGVAHSYKDGRYDLAGRGWLGFAEHVTVDQLSQATRTTTYENTARTGTFYPKAGLPHTEQLVVQLENGGTYQTTRTITYEVVSRSGDKVVSVYPGTVVSSEREGGHLLRQGRLNQIQDSYGNVTSMENLADVIVSGQPTGDQYRTLTSAQYDTSEPSWLIRELRRLSQTSTMPDGGAQTRVLEHDYYPDAGLLKETRIEPEEPVGPSDGGSEFFLKTTYERDAGYGLVSAVVSEGSGQIRTENIEYDDLDHTYPKSVTNALGHQSQMAYHSGLGVVARTQDPNGLSTRYQYDGFGRLRFEDAPDSSDVTYSYVADALGQLKIGKAVRTHQSTSRTTEVTHDRLGREASSRWQNFDGTYVSIDKVYDARGRMLSESLPHSASEPAHLRTFTYDNLDRPLRDQHPDGTYKERSYAGRGVIIFDEKRNTSYFGMDELGRVTESVDFEMEGGGPNVATRLSYGPFGALSKVTQPGGVHATTISYDKLGRRTRLVDPDSGTREFHYNAFGELKTERNATGDVTSYTRDLLGRFTQINQRDGLSTFTWDTATNGIGKLAQSTNASLYAPITIQHTYDALSRPTQTYWTYTQLTDTVFNVDRSYDAFGRLQSLTYPAVTGRTRLMVERQYNNWGHLQSVRDAVTQASYWTAQSYNSYGQLTSEEFGNGATTARRYDIDGQVRFIETIRGGAQLQALAYEYESNGNLASRHDLVAKTSEDFTYDRLDRLTNWKVSQDCASSELKYRYDAGGNLLERAVISGPGASVTYTYGNGAGPHAVTGTSSAGITATYTYDANGNQRTAPNRQITYTSFDLPSTLQTGTETASYFYDADRQRVARSRSNGEWTYYVGGIYEQRKTNVDTKHVFYIEGGGRVVAQVLWTQSGGLFQADRVQYLHNDNLGSTETVSDGAGNVEHLKYDPFGTRRAPGALATPTALPHTDVRLGFTGHEPDDEAGLINMKGRMYDPVLGRFLTPDPFITLPMFGQSYNRYSYVLNNPLSFVDPTGFRQEGASGGGSGPSGDGSSGPYGDGSGPYGNSGPDGTFMMGRTAGENVTLTTPSQTNCSGCGSGEGSSQSPEADDTGVDEADLSPASSGYEQYIKGGALRSPDKVTVGELMALPREAQRDFFKKNAFGLVPKNLGDAELDAARDQLSDTMHQGIADVLKLVREGVGTQQLAGLPPIGNITPKILNRANHVFGPKSLARHNLKGVLDAFKGDQVEAFKAMERLVQKAANEGVIKGRYQDFVIQVAGYNVTVKGKVIDGVAHISTAYIP